MSLQSLKVSARLAKNIDRERVIACRDVLDEIKAILEKEYESLISKQQADENFVHPAWSERQARNIGEQIALKNIIDLITIKEGR